MPDHDCVEIVVCYGTSCFARGNAENLDLLHAMDQLSGSNFVVRLKGKLCQGQCTAGPNLTIAGNPYHDVTVSHLRELLSQLHSPAGNDHGTT